MIEYDSRQLLCTFATANDFRTVAEEIRKFYEVYSNRVFVFFNTQNPKEMYLTYNVLNMKKDAPKLANTILVHRKKQFNVLYSLNALNTLIKEEHGCLDKSFILDWKLYSNSLVISGDVSVRIVPLKIVSILTSP
jgi:hypothetical protein